MILINYRLYRVFGMYLGVREGEKMKGKCKYLNNNIFFK